MVYCCVPLCGADSWKCGNEVSFHEFPSSPDLAAKWIKQINSAVKMKQKPMWFPRGKSVICSNHFVATDFKDDSSNKKNILKPRAVPTVFGPKQTGNQNDSDQSQNRVSITRCSPLIVKVNRPSSNETGLVISDVFSHVDRQIKSENDTSETVPLVLPHSPDSQHTNRENRTSFLGALQYKNQELSRKLVESLKKPPSSLDPPTSYRNTPLDSNVKQVVSKKSPVKNVPHKRISKKESGNELIEIGPNTFLKINPDIIKVNKKQTPSGNTVLQFLMDQKVANQFGDYMPKIVKYPTDVNSASTVNELNEDLIEENNLSTAVNGEGDADKQSEPPKEDVVVQQIVGHLVDTHVCKDSCKELKGLGTDDDEPMDEDPSLLSTGSEKDHNITTAKPNQNYPVQVSVETSRSGETKDAISQSKKNDVSFLNKAPVLFTTNLPLSHCLTDKAKTAMLLKQKSRQIASLKQKMTSMTKKIEELEDRCIVQERQLSYSFIKKLKNIRKNASKGEPCATYILEQIRCYTGSTKMRWSDTTLTQCAIWCRKAPYAYEYFKKADFFKLPCLGTVKRFMKKHPDVKFVNKKNPGNLGDSDSSSDFTFDDSDNEKEANIQNSDVENIEPSVPSEIIVTDSEISGQVTTEMGEGSNVAFAEECTSKVQNSIENDSKRQSQLNSYPINFGGTTVEVQEIILPSGEVVQCYASNMCDGTDVGNQYYIIPNVDQLPGVEQEYNIVQTSQSVPVILQNLDSGPLQQDQLIFIANSTEQVECPETEIVTAKI